LAIIYRYASIAREDGDYSQAVKLFEPNATVHFPDGHHISPGNLGEITRSNPPKLLRYHLTTIDVQFVSSEDVWSVGSLDDIVSRLNDGTWLIKQKTVVVDGLDPEGWLATSLTDDLHGERGT
ncbi:hypothetical protein BGW36DRAFT_300010, partial [Talaromyces proteolyticus]